jgi:hypothetical protein
VQFLQAWSTLALSHVSLKEIRGLVTQELGEREATQTALQHRVLELEARHVVGLLSGAPSERSCASLAWAWLCAGAPCWYVCSVP